MKLVCLGTSGYQPSEARHTSCYFIPELGVLLDAGTGMFRARQRLMHPHLDILLSHAHLDHVIGLSFVLGWRELHGLESIHVYGPNAKLERIRQHIFATDLFPIEPPIQWCPLPDTDRDFLLRCGAKVRWWDQTHPGGSVGYRLDIGRHSVAYITDTTARKSDPYLDVIQDVSLLIHECNFDDDQQELARRCCREHRFVAQKSWRLFILVHTVIYGSPSLWMSNGTDMEKLSCRRTWMN